MTERSNNRFVGMTGEAIARKYLEDQGYRFVYQNYYTQYGELDLIFFDGNVLIFVEVKTRLRPSIRPIEDSINTTKINRIVKSAEIYIDRTQVSFEEMRYDVVFITKYGSEWDIEHIKNFF